MITNLNKNHSVLERKIMNLMAEKSQLKELNTNLTINILNQQKVFNFIEIKIEFLLF